MIRLATAGESHGPQLTVIVEGLPAGLPLNEDQIRADLARRQIALGAGGRMAIETDRAAIVGGVLAGRTTGAPVALSIANANHAAWSVRRQCNGLTSQGADGLRVGEGDRRNTIRNSSPRFILLKQRGRYRLQYTWNFQRVGFLL